MVATLIEPVARLIEAFSRLPGIGPKTAQRLTFHLKPRDNLTRVHSQLENLQRHAAFNRRLLFRYIDNAETPATDLVEQLITSDLVAGLFGDN